MRDATREELESVNKYIESISKPTGINFFTILENDSANKVEMEKIVMNRMTDEEYRNYALKTQFSIPRKLEYLADKYPTITWNKAKELYQASVEELLNEFEVECILDISNYGKGFVMASSLFESKLQREYIITKKG